jgi:hypothetical protein
MSQPQELVIMEAPWLTTPDMFITEQPRVFHIFFSSGAEVLQPGRCKELTHYYRSIFLKLSDMFFCNPKRSLAKIIVDFRPFANRLGYRKASFSYAVRALPPGNCPQNFRKQKGLAIVL